MRAALSALFLLAACTTTQAAPTPLGGSTWTLQSLPGQDVSAVQRPASLRFDAARANGSTGCNAWSAGFTQSGANLHFGAAMHTMMACVNGMDVERAFMVALDQTRSAGVDGDVLVLRDGSGHELARFSRAAPQGS